MESLKDVFWTRFSVKVLNVISLASITCTQTRLEYRMELKRDIGRKLSAHFDDTDCERCKVTQLSSAS